MRVLEVMNPVPEPLTPESSLLEAARRMAALNATALPVCREGRLVGLLSERALVLGAVQEDSDGDEIPAAEGRVDRAMSPDPITCQEDAPLEEVFSWAAGTGARHVVVLDDAGKVTGVLSLRDAWTGEVAPDGAFP